MGIAEKIVKLKEELPRDCTLVAVSKTKPASDILEAYHTGHRHFGENKVQELTAKYEELPKDIHWHMIGHLQRNKVKYLAPFVHLIHGVDSEKLLAEIDKQAAKHERIIDCLLQVHIAEEDTKFGFDETEVQQLLESDSLANYQHVKIVGLMGMATFTENEAQVLREFQGLKKMYDKFQSNTLPANVDLRVLSMGMSGDFKLAVQAGSNMARVGSLIFGER